MEIVPIAVAWMELMEFFIWFFSTFMIWGIGTMLQRTQKDHMDTHALGLVLAFASISGISCLMVSLLWHLPQALKLLALVYSS